MGGLSKAAESLPEGFGYVIFAYVGNEFVNMWMAINVGRARKQYEVEYPAVYHKEPGHVFNCIQRAHQNTLEGHPAFIVMLFLSGLQYPKVTAGIGAVHALAKIAYATGYYTGGYIQAQHGAGYSYIDEILCSADHTAVQEQTNMGIKNKPAKRRRGGFGHICDLLLLGGSLSLAFHELKLWPCN